jgi:PAS domain-containing protein
VGWRARSDTRLGAGSLAAVVALFAAIFVLRFLDGNAEDGVTSLYILPIALLAVELGLIGGLIGVAAAVVLLGIWIGVADPGLSAVGIAIRVVVFLAVGMVVGKGADRLRRTQRERGELLDEVRDQALHFDLSRDLLCRATLDGYFDRVNDRWTEVFGWSREGAVRPPVRGVRASQRSGVHRGRGGATRRGRYDGRVHQPLPDEGRRLAVAGVELGGGARTGADLCGRA